MIDGVTTSTFKVWGNCEMCKETIESSLKVDGITKADWNTESKIMIIKADFIINNTTTFSITDSVCIIDKSNMKYVEYDMGDGSSISTNRSNQTFKYKYSNAGNYTIVAKAFEHTEGLNPHKAKFKIKNQTITIN